MKMVQTKKKPGAAAKKPVGAPKAAKKPVGAAKKPVGAANKPKAAKKPVGAPKAAKKPVSGAAKANKPGSVAKAAKKPASGAKAAAANKPLKRAAAATAAKKKPGAPSGAAAKLPPRTKAVPKGYAPTARLDEAGRKVYTRGGRDYVKRKRADGKMGMRQTTKSKKFVGGAIDFNEIYRIMAARRANDPSALEKLNEFVEKFKKNADPDDAKNLRQSFEENFMEERASKLLGAFQELAKSIPDFMNNEQFKFSLQKLEDETKQPLDSIDLNARKDLLEEEQRYIEALKTYNDKKKKLESPGSSSESLYKDNEVTDVVETVYNKDNDKLETVFKKYNIEHDDDDFVVTSGSPPFSAKTSPSSSPRVSMTGSPSSSHPSQVSSASSYVFKGPLIPSQRDNNASSESDSDRVSTSSKASKKPTEPSEDYNTMLDKLFEDCKNKYDIAKNKKNEAIETQQAIENSLRK